MGLMGCTSPFVLGILALSLSVHSGTPSYKSYKQSSIPTVQKKLWRTHLLAARPPRTIFNRARQASQGDPDKDRVAERRIHWPSTKVSLANFASGALLGPNLDNYHGLFGVLTYAHPIVFSVKDTVLLQTSSFVPPTFGLAGFLIGSLYLTLDQFLNTTQSSRNPSGLTILSGIGAFSAQYYLSGLLAGGFHIPSPYLHLILAATMICIFLVFDRTKSGALVALATGLGGPLIELFLVNQLDLYSYADADFFGIDSWIPWVYAAGAPAVGNLARGYAAHANVDTS
ncbi:hypothetical protein AAMO2058_000150000 [Amorphochlora amoebiformis]